MQTKGVKGSTQNPNSLDSGARPGPYFDKAASKNVTALLGKTAYLNCKVKNLGNKSVGFFENTSYRFLIKCNKRKIPFTQVKKKSTLVLSWGLLLF